MKLARYLRAYFAERQDIQKWDYVPRHTGVVVSLTTIPSRIAAIKPVILSLLRQTVKPDQIEINLGKKPLRPDIPWQIPSWLTMLSAVKLYWIDEDLGPATKFIPPLLRYQKTNTLIIIVDDDMMYSKRLVERLQAADQQADGKMVFCANGHLITRNLKFFDHPTDRAIKTGQRRVAIIEGCGGYTLRAKHFDLDALMDFKSAPANACKMDDIWISGHLSRQGVVKLQIPVGRRYSLPQAARPAVLGARAEPSNAVLRYFANDWRSAEFV